MRVTHATHGRENARILKTLFSVEHGVAAGRRNKSFRSLSELCAASDGTGQSILQKKNQIFITVYCKG